MSRSENGKYTFLNHVYFLLESVIFIRDVPVLILLLVHVVVVVVGPCTTTNAVATDVVIRNNTEVNRMNIILIIMSWKSCCCSKGICNCEYREVMDGNDADGWLVAYFVYTQMSCQKSDRWIRWFGLLFSPSRLRGQSEWWFDVLRVYTVDRSTHTTNQLKHVRVVVVGGIEYRSIDPPPKNLWIQSSPHRNWIMNTFS